MEPMTVEMFDLYVDEDATLKILKRKINNVPG